MFDDHKAIMGILSYSGRPMRVGSVHPINLGDPIQSYAAECILRTIGYTDPIKYLDKYSLASYQGEKIRLLFNAFNMIVNQSGYDYKTLPVSDDVSPCFFSFQLHTRNIPKNIVDQLVMYSPIGCRDFETYQNLSNHKIPCFISGCITITLPSRNYVPVRDKVFFVDIPDSLYDYIPDSYLMNGEFLSHQPNFTRVCDTSLLTRHEYSLVYNNAIKLLNRYKNEATLIVTSRLHVASPAVAMGIPTILVRDNIDGRFGCIGSLINIYTPDNFSSINWSPDTVCINDLKKLTIDALEQCLKPSEYCDINKINSLNNYWQNREGLTHDLMLKKKLDDILFEFLQCDNDRSIIIWGIIPETQQIKHLIDDFYPELDVVSIVDISCFGYFENVPIINPSQLNHSDGNVLVIVVPKAAHDQAKLVLSNLNYKFCLL